LVGTSNSPSDPVNVDTDNLTEGTYDLTLQSQAEDGTTEETTTTLTITKPSFFARFRLPLIVAGATVVLIGVLFTLKAVMGHAVPFYRTLNQH
jgi:hypothetical protein